MHLMRMKDRRKSLYCYVNFKRNVKRQTKNMGGKCETRPYRKRHALDIIIEKWSYLVKFLVGEHLTEEIKKIHTLYVLYK